MFIEEFDFSEQIGEMELSNCWSSSFEYTDPGDVLVESVVRDSSNEFLFIFSSFS